MSKQPIPRPRRFLVRLSVGGLAVALVLAAAATSQDDAESPARVPEELLNRPGVMPDRVILTWSGDPATTQAVTWRTNSDVSTPKAQFAPAGENKQFAEAAVTVDATTEELKTDLNTAFFHTAKFTELKPDTLYAHRVGDGTNWTEWYHFRTAATEAKPFTFIYFGDAQNDVKTHWSRVIRQAYSQAKEAKFLLHAGDLINSANRDAEWGEWFNAGGWLNGTLPSVATPGNHEYRGGLSRHWRPQFSFPENGPEGLLETVYYFDYQGVRFISLNSNEGQDEQVPWLKGVLKDNPNRWTIVTFHHPIFSPARGRDNRALRALWKPVLDEFSVDLVLQGHDHTYGRSGLIHGANVAVGTQLNDSKNGTVYVVSVSGPKMYSLSDDADWMKRSTEQTQLFQVIRVAGGRLRYEAYTATGELYDDFELTKAEDGTKTIAD